MDVSALSDDMATLLASETVTLAYAADLDFKDGRVRAHTGTGELIIEGQTYIGVGTLGNVSEVSEAPGADAPQSVRLTLSGWDNDVAKGTLEDRCRGREGRLMLVAFRDDGSYLADILFAGVMDAADMSYAGNQGDNAISVKITDELAAVYRRGAVVWSDANHRARYPGDRFFYAVAQMASRAIYWGNKRDAPGFKYTE
ncbi:hypothetical protein [Vreelandella aquamarina]|uniref:hypothetical protein n=1 Tax=Vreelandella aquamarina TaxID=77097 RepID=UPI001D18C25A|nr:hypothetical protein [Halomonas meridiana]MCC4288527.1 hypothetical protein [Halomonas meridiana]